MGKKFKQTRKPRTEHIYATTVGEIDYLDIHVDQRTGDISFGSAMSNVYLETSYPRTKGPKVVSRLPQRSSALAFGVDRALEANFDFLCAVDTNTREINGHAVSATCLVTFRRTHVPGPTGIESGWQMAVPFGFEFVNLTAEPVENFCWLHVYDELVRRQAIAPGTRVGMVVDSNLGQINSYNAGHRPVFGERHLPDGLQFIYASTDTGKDNILNHVLGTADGAAAQFLAAVDSGTAPFNAKKVSHPLYEGIREISVKVVETAKRPTA